MCWLLLPRPLAGEGEGEGLQSTDPGAIPPPVRGREGEVRG
jgi:hypothetical protein